MNPRLKHFMLAAYSAMAFVPAMGFAGGPVSVPTKATGAMSDMKVARDKETGQLRAPTAEESAALSTKARAIAPNVVVISRPVTTVQVRADGSVVANRSLDDMDNLVLTRGFDGRAFMRHAGPSTVVAPAAAATK